MPITYVIDQVHRAVLSDVRGTVSMADVVDVTNRLRREPFFQPTFSLLIDLSETQHFNIAAEDLGGFVHTSHDPFQPGIRRAIVATRPDSYGVARMYQNLAGDLNICIFRSRDEALSWLGLVPVNRG
jgi:hypothetical protein